MKKAKSYLIASGVLAFAAPAIAQGEGAERDLAIVAQSYGITQAEARERIMLQREAAALAKQLRERPNFSGMEIRQSKDGMALEVSFAQGAPVPEEVINQFPRVKGLLKVRQTGREIAAQRSLRGRIASILARSKIDASIAQKSIDGGVIVETDSVEQVKALVASLDSDIDVRFNPRPVPPPAVNLQGGNPLAGCTSGFGAADSLNPSQKGMLSAGHCVVGWNETVAPGKTVTTQGISLPVPRARFHEEDDFLWGYSASHPGTNQIYDGVGLRSISSVRYAIVVRGQDVCKYGKRTGLKCGVVTEPERTWTTASSGLIGPLVEITNNRGENIGQCGDSGGPVFMMNEAYGILSRADANGSCLGGSQFWYADIYYAGELGVEVLIN